MQNNNIILEKARDGNWTCKINVNGKWKYMYSKYRPVKKINNIRTNSNYIIFGLGLGYELKQIVENSSGLIYVIEKDKTFYELIKEFNILDEFTNSDRVILCFGDNYKQINLDNYIIYNNENITQIDSDFYYKAIKYFKDEMCRQNKKRIVVYDHVTIAEDCIEAFKSLQYDVIKLNFSTIDKMIQDIININPDYIFSINLSEKISEIAEKLSLPYISWTVDTPAHSLYGNLLKNKNNIAFIYDYRVMQYLSDSGFKNVFYMPVAANINRLDKIKVNSVDLAKYSCEVSFLGTSDYNNDFNKYINYFLSEETDLKIQKILQKQFLNENKFIIKDIIDDEIIDKIQHESGYDIIAEEFISRKDKLAILIGRKFNQIQRVSMIRTLSAMFNLHVYGDDTWGNLNDDNVIYRGYAEHFNDMPKVFKCSKVNINQIRVYVDSGLPMRVFDVLGSKGFLVTNYKQDIEKYFVDGKDLVIYRDIKDLVEIIKYYLNHEEERQEIIVNGYQKIKNGHTYDKRLKEIMKITDEYFKL